MTEERRPTFAREFPRDAALDALVEAFARGDYARVRREAPALGRSTTDAEIKKAAELLVERTRPDPLAVRLLWVTAVLLAAMTTYWVIHGKAPPGSGPTRPPVEHPR